MLYCLLWKVLSFVENFACWQVGIEMVLLMCTDANEPWKLNTVTVSETNCCNQPKSLSGIETDATAAVQNQIKVAINLNPYQGLKHRTNNLASWKVFRAVGCNQPKSLSGIETLTQSGSVSFSSSCNQPKSLSGIETDEIRKLILWIALQST